MFNGTEITLRWRPPSPQQHDDDRGTMGFEGGSRPPRYWSRSGSRPTGSVDVGRSGDCHLLPRRTTPTRAAARPWDHLRGEPHRSWLGGVRAQRPRGDGESKPHGTDLILIGITLRDPAGHRS